MITKPIWTGAAWLAAAGCAGPQGASPACAPRGRARVHRTSGPRRQGALCVGDAVWPSAQKFCPVGIFPILLNEEIEALGDKVGGFITVFSKPKIIFIENLLRAWHFI